MNQERSIFRDNRFIMPLFLALAALFVTLTSYTTSPLYSSGWFENDGKVFLFVAKGMLDGRLPYRDIFDHKGPVLYFIQCLGWALTDSALGVYLIQIINLFATLFVMFKGVEEFLSPKRSFFVTLAALPFFISTLFGGNYSEEWSMFFSAVSFTLACRYISGLGKGQSKHNIYAGFLLGFSFGFNALIRLNNCILAAVSVLFIVICLLVHRQFKNLLLNAAAFIAGAALTAVPPLIYFGRFGAIADLLYGSLGFNLKYSEANQLINQNAAMSLWTSAFPLLLVCGAAAAWALIKLQDKKRRLLSWFLLCMCGCLFAMYLVTGVTYLHYLAFVWPVPVLFYCLIAGQKDYKIKDFAIRSSTVIVCLAIISGYYFNIGINPSVKSTVNIIKQAVSGQEYELAGFARVLDQTVPEDESDDVFCLASSFSVLYLYDEADLYPKNRYVLFFEFWKLIDGQVTTEIREMMQNNPPRWLISKEGEWDDRIIREIIDRDYSKVYSEGDYELYRLGR